MREVFDDEELEPARERPDTELTLSPMVVLGFLFGLVLLCGLCFGLGYTVGNHGKQQTPASAVQSSLPAAASTAKPSASTAPQPAPVEQSATDPSGLATDTTSAATPQAADSGSAPTLRPALPDSSQPMQFMVQIAVLSNAEDASVLTSALRKRGYAVTASSSAGENLIHVRVGPYASRVEASQWRLKLLNDGYNAVVQP